MSDQPENNASLREESFNPRAGRIVNNSEFMQQLDQLQSELQPAEQLEIFLTEKNSMLAFAAAAERIVPDLLSHAFYDSSTPAARGDFIDGVYLDIIQKTSITTSVNPEVTRKSCELQKRAFDKCEDKTPLLRSGRLRAESTRLKYQN